VSCHSKRKSTWLTMASVLAWGTLFQVSCIEMAATATRDLSSSIATEFIRNLVFQYFGVGFGFSF